MKTANLRGTMLSYVEAGQGQPLVFVHGSLEDYRSWRGQMGPFGERYHVVAYSRRYHYPNPGSDGPPYTAEMHAEDMAAFIEALDLGPVHLVCSSYGGYTALCLARRRLDLVRSLVLGEPPLMPWLESVPDGAPLAHAFYDNVWMPAARSLAAGDPEHAVRLFLNAVVGREVYDFLPAATRIMPMDNAPAMRAESTSAGYFSPFTCAEAGRIDRPALVLDGERSPRLFCLITDELIRCLPRATHAVIPGAAHAMHIDNPEAYNETVLAFLAGCD